MSGLRSALHAVREHSLEKLHTCAGCGGRFPLRYLTRYASAYWCARCAEHAIDGLW